MPAILFLSAIVAAMHYYLQRQAGTAASTGDGPLDAMTPVSIVGNRYKAERGKETTTGIAEVLCFRAPGDSGHIKEWAIALVLSLC